MKKVLTTMLTVCMLAQPFSVMAAPVADSQGTQATETTTQATEVATEQATTEAKTEATTAAQATTEAPAKKTVSYKLNDNKVVVAVSSKKKVSVKGADEDDVDWKVANKSVATVDGNGTIVGKKAGTTKVVATVDDQEVTGEVVITNAKLSKTSGTIAKNEKTAVSINGINEESTATVTTSGITTTAKVENKKLYIQPKKVGKVKVTVNVDGKKSTYTATVTTRTALKAIANAKNAKGCRYSQAKRMRKGYYDCSSLIWRIYKPYGVYFGKKSYCPTAAEEARNMAKNKKVVSYKRVSSSKLLPGDVIFYSYTRNGRYRNISHVALYIGNGKIIHAANSRVGVIEANYKYSSCIKMIVRPTK